MGHGSLPGGAPPELTEQRSDIVVFACGDPAHAEHESIAIAACTTLPEDLLERLDVKLVGPMRPEYLRDLAPRTHAFIADTFVGTPGQITLIPLLELNGREEPLVASSTTDQPLDEVVAMAQLLREAPLRGRFVGIGVESVDLRRRAPADAVEVMRGAIARAVEELDAS